MEPILVLLGLALAVWIVACLTALPIGVLLQWRRISFLEKQLRELESRLETPVAEVEPVPPEPTAEAPPVPVTVVPEPAPARPLHNLYKNPRAAGRPLGAELEAWIGRRGLGWVAVVLLLFGTAFFLKQVFANRWIGETGRVAIGVVAGAALCGAGLRYHLRNWRVFSQMATAGGIVLLYLSTFGAFGYYHLLPREHAAVFLVVLVAESALVALLYDAPAIAIMALVGALLAPPLLATEHDQYRSLFLYLAAVDMGALAVLLVRPWPVLGTLALLCTHGLFWGWYEVHYHPEKLPAAMAFQGGVFALFLVYSLASHWLRRRKAGAEDLVRLVLNAGLFFAAVYVLLDDDYHVWMGTLAMGMAVVYAALAAMLLTRPEDGRQSLVATGISLGFLAAVFPLQAEAAWIALGWAVEGAVLWWFGLRVRQGLLRGMGVVLLALAVGRLLLVDSPEAHYEPFIPVVNAYALPALAVAACLLAAALAAWRFRDRTAWLDRSAAGIAGLGGLALICFILSQESYQYFITQIDRPIARRDPSRGAMVDQYGRPLGQVTAEQAVELHRLARTSLSVVWAVYAALVLGLGFWLRSRAVRWMALALFALTLLKVVVVDMAGLPGFYRVAVFFALAVMMAVAAWAYQRWHFLEKTRSTDQSEDTEHGSLENHA